MITLEKTNNRGKFGCGALATADPDPRNYQWKNLGIGSRLTVNNSEQIPFEVLNQGDSNACGGFAAAYYKFAIEYRQIQNTKKFSPYTTYGWRVSGAYMGEGMYTEDINKGMLQHGVPFYQPWDNGIYTAEEACKLVEAHKAEFADEAYKFRNQSYYECTNWVEVMQAIKATGGCLIMIPIYRNYWTNLDGYIEVQEGTETGLYHFLCAIDYTDDFKYVKCINSWGDYNELGGYIYLNTDNITLQEATAWVDPFVEEELKAFSFPDVATDRWSYGCIQICARNHIMDGFEDGTFRPNEPLTRDQATRVMSTLLDLDPVPYKNCFKDVEADRWSAQFIQACYNAGIIVGTGEDKFEGERSLTREQMAVILVNAYNITPRSYHGEFEDVKSDRWSSGYIATVYSENLMVGVSDTEFCPESPITREQMAVIACKLIGAV